MMASTVEREESEKSDIDLIWTQVQERVVKLAGGDSGRLQKHLDIDGVLAFIDRAQASQKKKSDKYSWFRTAVSRTLQCIQTVGGVVSSAASQAFGPAEMCFNALTFVIQAWQGYEGMFENLGELLEKCVEFLERLDYYKPKMDARLSRLACQNLQLFVELCDAMIKLRRKHNRLAAFTKQLFLNDNGIQDLLSMMDRLNSKESLLVSAQTYKIVSDSADGIKLILDSQQEQKKVEDSKNWRTKIVNALGFTPANLGSDGEPIAGWDKTINHCKNRLIEGTGSWLTDHEAFVSWAESPSPDQNLLIIEGKSGSGKTSLMANGLRILRKYYASSSSTTARIVSAFYSPEADTKRNMTHIDGALFESASKALLWQLCTSYEAITKSTAHIIDRQGDFDGNMDLWRVLLLENRELHNQDTTFFIFIDGVDPDLRSFVPLLERLSSHPDLKRKVRVCITTQIGTSADWLIMTHSIPFTKVHISDHNTEDIKHCIRAQLDATPIFQDRTRVGIQEWRNRILDTLVEKCEGDYFRINNILKKLSVVDLISDIEAILADAGKTRIDQIDAEIQRLNIERTPAEIAEINTIVRWVLYGTVFVTTESMQSLLSIRSRKRNNSGLPDHARSGDKEESTTGDIDGVRPVQSPSTLSLLPFRQKLQEKYSIFTTNELNCVDWRTPEVKDRIPRKTTEDSGLEDSITGQLDTIRDSEVQIVQHFLHTVCPPDLYRRFGFESFFAARLSVGLKEKIYDDVDNAHILCALDCLKILLDDELSSEPELCKLAMHSLLSQLKDTDLALADRRLKEQVGPMLVRVLTESNPIDRLFVAPNRNNLTGRMSFEFESLCEENRMDWVYATSGTEIIVRWLRDSAVTKNISGEQAEKFLHGVKDPSVNQVEAILGHVAKRMAQHLFHGSTGELHKSHPERYPAMATLRAYLVRLYPTETYNEEGAKLLQHTYDDFWNSAARDFFEAEFVLPELLDRLETWATGILGRVDETPSRASAWEMNMAFNYSQLTRIPWFDDAKICSVRAKAALELDPSNWDALLYLCSDPDYHNIPEDEALNLLQKAKSQVDEALLQDSTWLDDPNRRNAVTNITLALGRALWVQKLESHDPSSDIPLDEHLSEAVDIQLQSLEFGNPDFRAVGTVANLYKQARRWKLWMQFIDKFTSYSGRWAPSLEEMNNTVLACYYRDWNWLEQNKFGRAADGAQGWDTIKNFFMACIDASLIHGRPPLQLNIQVHYGMTLTMSSDNERISEGIQKLSELLTTKFEYDQDDEFDVSMSLLDIKLNLGIYYLREALKENQTETQRIKLGEKLAEFVDKEQEPYSYTYHNAKLTLACCLIRYEVRFRNGQLSDISKTCLHHIMMGALEILSDDDDDNDANGYQVLQTVFGVLSDLENLHTAWVMWAAFIWDDKRKTERGYLDSQREEASARPPSEEVSSSISVSGNNSGEINTDSFGRRASSVGTEVPDIGTLVKTDPNNITLDQKNAKNLDNNQTPPQDDDEDAASVTSELLPINSGYSIWEYCRYCGASFSTVNKPMRFCLDCPGRFCVEEECFESFKAGEPSPYLEENGGQAYFCSPHHTFYATPAFPYSLRKSIPVGHVIVGGSTKDDLEFMSLEEWKASLRKKYMES